MNIEIVCRMNQARSILAEAASSRIFPEVNFSSSGLFARELLPIPRVSQNALDYFGLISKKEHSELTSSHQERIANSDVVVSFDSRVKDYLESIGISGKSLHIVSELDSHKTFNPIDPINLIESEFNYEIAVNVLYCLNFLWNRLCGASISFIQAVVPETINVIPSSLELLDKIMLNQDTVIINFIPESVVPEKFWRKFGQQQEIYFAGSQSFLKEFNRSKVRTFHLNKNFGDVKTISISQQFKDLVKILAADQKVVILSQPLRREDGTRIPSTALSLAYSSKVHLVQKSDGEESLSTRLL